jgi:hypothetical protein
MCTIESRDGRALREWGQIVGAVLQDTKGKTSKFTVGYVLITFPRVTGCYVYGYQYYIRDECLSLNKLQLTPHTHTHTHTRTDIILVYDCDILPRLL